MQQSIHNFFAIFTKLLKRSSSNEIGIVCSRQICIYMYQQEKKTYMLSLLNTPSMEQQQSVWPAEASELLAFWPILSVRLSPSNTLSRSHELGPTGQQWMII